MSNLINIRENLENKLNQITLFVYTWDNIVNDRDNSKAKFVDIKMYKIG